LRDDLARWAWRLFAAVALAPIGASLLWGALYSVGLAGLLAQGFTLEAWRRSLGEAELWRSLGLSVAIALAVAGLSVSLSLAIALGMRRALARGPLASVLALPLAIPASVAAFLALQTLGGGGLIDRVLAGSAGSLPSLVGDPHSIGIVLTHTALAVPFFTLVFSRLRETEHLDALEDLARALGAGRAQVLRRVSLPVLLRAASGNILLLAIVCLGSYEIPLLLGRQSPEMLSVFTMRKFTFYDIGRRSEAYVAALVYTALAGVLVAIAFRRRPGGAGAAE